MSKYDIIIIGSGLGGLECGAILSKEGFNVCVVEKNTQFGGCFQTYRRKGHLFDTGIHYVGSLDEGQVMNQYFRYFGIMDKLKLKRLDDEAFDTIYYKGKTAHLQSSVFKLSKDLIDSIHEEGIVAYTS